MDRRVGYAGGYYTGSVGSCGQLFVSVVLGDTWTNEFRRKLAKFTEDTAKEMQMPFSHASIPGASSDSVPFVEMTIPAVTIHGLSNDWPRILHSGNDQTSRINPLSVYLGYRLVLAMVVTLDQSPCAAYK